METESTSPFLEGKSADDLGQRMQILLKEMYTPDNLQFQPELIVMELFNLYDPRNPDKSWLTQYVSDPSRVENNFNCLLVNGTFSHRLADDALQKALEQIKNKRESRKFKKGVYRTLKEVTKAASLLGVVNEEKTFIAYALSVGAMYGMWGLIDRATADPKEREIAQAVALALTLQGIFREPEERTDVNPAVVSRLLFGKKPDEVVKNAVADWQSILGQKLYKEGVLPKTIFDELMPRPHTPFQKSKESAEERIMKDIRREIDRIAPPTLSDETYNWSSKEAIDLRRQTRMDWASQALIMDLADTSLPLSARRSII